MGGSVGVHQNIFKFIESLKKEQTSQEQNIARIEAGTNPDTRRIKYTKHDAKLLELVKKFDDDIHVGSFLPYLKSIAHNTQF